MFPVNEAIFWQKKGFSVNSGHKILAAIGKYDKSNDGMFLPFLFSLLTFVYC